MPWLCAKVGKARVGDDFCVVVVCLRLAGVWMAVRDSD